MALTLSNWKKAKNDSRYYNALSDDGKKKFWEYGVSNGLVPYQNLPSGAKAEMAKYGVSKDFYDPQYLKGATDKQSESAKQYQKEELRFGKRYAGEEKTGEVKLTNKSDVLQGALPEYKDVTKAKFKPLLPYTTKATEQKRFAPMPSVDEEQSAQRILKRLYPDQPKTVIGQLDESKVRLTPQEKKALDERNQRLIGTKVGSVLYGGLEGVASPFRYGGQLVGQAFGAGLPSEEELKYTNIIERNRLTPKMDVSKGFTTPNVIEGRESSYGGLGRSVGYLLPFTRAEKAVQAGLGVVAPKLVGTARNVVSGGIVGGTLQAIEEGSQGKRGKELLTDVLKGVAMGAAIDVGIGAFGSAIKKASNGQPLNATEVKSIMDRYKVSKEDVDNAVRFVKEPPVVYNDLGIPSTVSAQDYLKRQAQIARDVESDVYLEGLENQIKRQEVPVSQQIDTPKIRQSESRVTKETPIVEKTITASKKPLESSIIEPQAQSRFAPETEAPEGMKYSKANETFANAQVTGDELVKRINENPIKYKPTTREAQKRVAKEIVDNDFEAAIQMVRNGDRFKSDVENAVGYEVFSKLQQQGRYDESFEIMEALSRKGTNAGKEIESFKIWAKSTPEGMQRYAYKVLEESGTKVDGDFINEVGNRMREVSKINDVEQLKKYVESRVKTKAEKKIFGIAANNETAERLREMATMQIMGDVFKKIDPKTFEGMAISQGRKLSTAQAMAQLLSFVTFQRNIYGNTLSLMAEQIAKYPATVADIGASLFTKKRTVSPTVASGKIAYSQGIEQAKRSLQEIMAGIQVNTGDKKDLIMQPAFANIPILREMEKALSISLSTPDEFFKGIVTADSMHNQLRARIGKAADSMTLDEIKKAITPEEFERALSEAMYATFQNDSLPAKILTEMKRTLNRVGYGGKGLDVKEFGAGDLIIKYTKVPGNIIARGVEFSPLGYMKVLSKAAEMSKNPSAQREFAQTFGRATTGTGLMGAGALLYNNGIIVGEDNNLDPKERALLKAEGKSGYRLNVDALKRFVTGGKTDIRQNDKLMAFDSIQPISIPFIVGASTAEKSKQKGITKGQIVNDVTGKTMDEVLDLPSLYVINQIYRESQKDKEDSFGVQDVAKIVLSESVPGFVPAFSRQAAQSIDPVIRETYTGDVTETMKNKIKSQIPLLSKTLQPKITPTGKEATRIGGLAPFLDPFKTTKYEPTGFTDKLQDIKKLSGAVNQFPPTYAPKQITIGKEKVALTPEEKTLYMKIVGSEIERRFNMQLSNVDTTRMNATQAKNKADQLSNIISSAKKKAEAEITLNRRKNK